MHRNKKYMLNNMSKGLCPKCPNPRSETSVECEGHRAKAREWRRVNADRIRERYLDRNSRKAARDRYLKAIGR